MKEVKLVDDMFVYNKMAKRIYPYKYKSRQSQDHFEVAVVYLLSTGKTRNKAAYYSEETCQNMAHTIVARYNFDGKGFRTFKQIGEEIGLSQSRANNIFHQSIRRINNFVKYKKVLNKLLRRKI